MAEESPRTRISLINGESITIDGDIEQVVATLKAGQGNLTELQTGEDRTYVNPEHVTHL
jgi:uncharacterized protein YlzI (FlbEa/FlbD family)